MFASCVLQLKDDAYHPTQEDALGLFLTCILASSYTLLGGFVDDTPDKSLVNNVLYYYLSSQTS